MMREPFIWWFAQLLWIGAASFALASWSYARWFQAEYGQNASIVRKHQQVMAICLLCIFIAILLTSVQGWRTALALLGLGITLYQGWQQLRNTPPD